MHETTVATGNTISISSSGGSETPKPMSRVQIPWKTELFWSHFLPVKKQRKTQLWNWRVLFFFLCASHHSVENNWMYVEIIAVSFVVKVAKTNQMEHRFTYQKYIVSLVFLYCYLSPQYFHSYSIHCWKGEQIIPPFYISKIVMIL